MALPKIAIQTYRTKLESMDSEIQFRPFLVREEKMLLMAMEGGNTEEMVEAIFTLLNACIITEGIKVEDLPSFDVEKLFFEVRKKSVGEVIELHLGHKHGHECPHKQKVSVDLNALAITKDETHNKRIKLNNEIGVVMRYPTTKMIEAHGLNSIKSTFELIAECIEQVYTSQEVYKRATGNVSDGTVFSNKDIVDWMEQLNDAQMQMLFKFFQTMPQYKCDVVYQCEKCSEEVKLELRGLKDFFT